MEQYVNQFALNVLRIERQFIDVNEEVNDSEVRNLLLLSLEESIFNLQFALRVYLREWSFTFKDSQSANIKAALEFNPSFYIKRKLARRVTNCLGYPECFSYSADLVSDDLPF